MNKTMDMTIATPEGIVFEGKVESAKFPGASSVLHSIKSAFLQRFLNPELSGSNFMVARRTHSTSRFLRE